MADQQQTPYTPDVDPLEALLRRSSLNDRQRAGLWDLYEASGNADDLSARLESIQLAPDVKQQLFILKSQETAPVPTEAQPEAPQGSALSRFASNAWEMVNPISIAKGLYHTSIEPMETGKAVLSQSIDQARKSRDAFQEGRFTEAKGHALGMTPVIGPLAVEAGEQIASGDVAGGLGKATGMLAPFGAAEGVARVGVKAAPASIANKLEAGAASRYADVMSPKSSAAKGQRMTAKAEKIAPDLAKDTSNAAWSRSGLESNLEDKLHRAAQALDEAADARNAGKPYETKPVVAALRAERAKLTAQPFDATHRTPEYRGRGARTAESGTEFTASGSVEAADLRPHQRGYRTLEDDGNVGRLTPEPERAAVPLGREVVPHHNKARVAEIDRAIAEVEALGPIAPYEALRRIRASYDGPAQVKYSPAVTPDYLANQSVASGAADVSGVIRETLAKGDPVTAAANADYSLYKSARDITKAASELEKARPRTGRLIMAKLTGSIIGGAEGGTVGAVTGYAAGPIVDQLLASGVTTKLQTAKLMQDLATAIRTGNVERTSTLSFKIRQLAKQGEAVRARGSADQAPMPQPSRQ